MYPAKNIATNNNCTGVAEAISVACESMIEIEAMRIIPINPKIIKHK